MNASRRDDDAFIEAFESCTLSTDEFHHADHVRLAWLYLREGSLLAAIERFTSGLRRFAAHHGVPGLYHETITWAYLLLIQERMSDETDFATFAAAHPDLFVWKPSILARYYREETLASPVARTRFVLPDRGLSAAPSA